MTLRATKQPGPWYKRTHQRNVKTKILFFALGAFIAATEASELNRESLFDSVEEFLTAVKAFQPVASKGGLASLFTIPEMGHENPGKPTAASAIQSCEPIWSDDKSALLFATANPPTVGTYSNIGVLFLLVHQRDGWRIADLLRFTATGKDSALSAKQTAFAGGGGQLSSEGFHPVVTVNELQGGRGYSYETCASYTFARSKLKRLELE
jgi:hypothetical protein